MSRDTHLRHEENIAAYVLGALPELERQALENHLDHCETCRAELKRLRPPADSLAFGVTPAAPPPQLKAALMAEVEKDVSPEAAKARRVRPRRRFTFLLRPAFAVAVLVVGVLAGLGVSQLGDDSRTVTAQIDTARIASARGELIVPDDGRAVLRLSRMPQLEDGRTYQLWILEDGKARPESLFSVDRHGNASAAVTDALDDADAVMVTRESAGGADAPTEKPVVTVQL